MSPRIKSWAFNFAKLAVAGCIIGWLIRSGKLDLASLGIFLKRPGIMILPLAGYFLVNICIAAYRWYTLLKGIGLQVEFRRVMQLHMIGIFFNLTMPGAVGGDLIKAVYVIRDHASFRTKAMLTILLDRILGLMGLFTLGATMALANLGSFTGNAALGSLVFVVLGLFAATILFFVLVFVKIEEEKDPIKRLLSKQWPGFALLEKIYAALLVYKKHPWVLVKCLGLSVVIQGWVLFLIVYFTTFLNGQIPPLKDLVTTVPVALLLTALPIAPAGLGVGHAAFAEIFRIVGVPNGANVFNVYMLTQLLLNLTGVVPYLLFKKKTEELTDEIQAQLNT